MKMEDTPIIENGLDWEAYEEEKAIQQLFLRSSWCYQIPPTDEWSEMHRLEDVIRNERLGECTFLCGKSCTAQMQLCDEEENEDDESLLDIRDWIWHCPKARYFQVLRTVEQAKKDMKEQTAWEGDIRGNKIYVFFLPFPSTALFGLAWKQENNGTTFVWSPVELAYLKEESY